MSLSQKYTLNASGDLAPVTPWSWRSSGGNNGHLLNRVVFNTLNGDVSQATVGRVIGQSNTPQQAQVPLWLEF